MATYRMRFFFDGCTGHCLWSDSDAALEKYHYPVFLDELPASDEVKRVGAVLLDRVTDDSTDWTLLVPEARSFLDRLRVELGPDFEIVDEMSCCGTLAPAEKINRDVLK